MYGWLTAAAAGAVVALLTTGIVIAAGPAQAASARLLPDLRQAPVGCAPGKDRDPGGCTAWDVCPVADPANPHATCVSSGPIRAVRLRFTSSEENIGDGPLLLYGHRNSTASPTMAVRQAFQSGVNAPVAASFAEAQQPLPASTYYEPAVMHKHWHLLGFDRFQLLAGNGAVVVADRKNGFCLGDRYDISDAASLPHAVRDDGTPQGNLGVALADNDCKMHNPSALDVMEGISVGSGDNYDYTVDYQWLDITAVPSGTYTVVNTVNPDHSIVESNYANNSSSIAISLRWPGGATAAPTKITAPPVVTLLRSCPGSAHSAA
jgi:hypothetical protein